MQETNNAAILSLKAAQQEYDRAARALHMARTAIQAEGDVETLMSALERARNVLAHARDAYLESSSSLKLALEVLHESVIGFERAEVALRIARAAAGDPAARKMVATEVALLEREVETARARLEEAGHGLALARRK